MSIKRVLGCVALALCFTGCAVPQSQGQARYDVVLLAVPITETEAAKKPSPFDITDDPVVDIMRGGGVRRWEAIKVDRYTGETWILAKGGWQPIATVNATP